MTFSNTQHPSERSTGDWMERAPEPMEPLRLAPDHMASFAAENEKSVQSSTIDLDLSTVLLCAVQRCAQKHQVEVDAVLLTAFAALLSRVTEHRQVLLHALAVSAHSTQIGCRPVRAALTEDTSFEALLHQVGQQKTTVMLGTAGVEIASPRSTPILFAGDLALLERSTFELALTVTPLPDSLRLTLCYAADRYHASTANRLLDMLTHLLKHAVNAPEMPVDTLRLTSPAQQEMLLRRATGPVLDMGQFEPVPAAVQQMAGVHPDRVAVECGGDSRTYRQLVSRAEAIAERMTATGVVAGNRVALCLSRSVDMPAALLAVLLCGCAYVPLDPLFPLDRMHAVLQDAEAALLLTDGSASVPHIAPLLDIRGIGAAPAAVMPSIDIRATDVAYIIYTSGSTGTPKGVTIHHGALRSLLLAAQQTPGFTADDVLVAITTLTFDISVMDMWLPLFTGARLVLATQQEARNPALLEALLNRSRATMLQATPGFWRAMVEHGWTTHAPGAAAVRVLCGGESLSRDLADLLLQRAPEVWNMYGPTECTVWISATRVTAGTQSPPVDQPLPNAAMYVLDRSLQPLPPGVTGELVLGGGNVGAGYWNRPDLTAEKFVPNPFGPGLLYRTGDLAQLQSEGGMRLLGRADFQVKVRGFRIELGEIEHVLSRHASVREAVVVQQTLPGMPASQPLVAYVDVGANSAESERLALLASLHAALRKDLPEYMVPAAIIPLAELPRLFNGKVDRKALPPLTSLEATAPSGDYLAPRDFLERQLAQIWQETLGLPQIGIDTSYFSLGADSLSALRLINRVNRTFAMKLGLADLLTSNSIALIADAIREHHQSGVTRALVPLRRDGSRAPLFLLHGVGGNILTFMGLAGHLPDDQPVYALQAQSLITGEPALLRLEDMAAYYVREMQSVQPHGPYHLLGYSFGGTLAMEMARQLRQNGEDVALLAMLDARTRTYEQAYQHSLPPAVAVQGDLARLAGNTSTLSLAGRLHYIAGKLVTRSVRLICMAFHALGLRRLPAVLKVTWDINLVAFRRYRPHRTPGRLVLFRAKQQEFADGPVDLGWAPLFPEGIELHELDGDHERVFVEPALSKLAAQITAVLSGGPKPVGEVHA